MAEYIEREALLNSLSDIIADYKEEKTFSCDFAATVVASIVNDVVMTIPAADVVEVRHERWEWGYRNGQYGIWCTNCGVGWVDSENAEWIAHEHDYCPKCGAKMDGKGEG